MEVAQGHDAVGRRQRGVLAQGVMNAPRPATSPVPLLLEEASLAQVVLPPQGEAAQGETQVLRSAGLLLLDVAAADEGEFEIFLVLLFICPFVQYLYSCCAIVYIFY